MMFRFSMPILAVMQIITLAPYAEAQQRPSMERILNRMDADGDGQVTHREWLGNPRTFRLADGNKDNILTKEELVAFFGSAGEPKTDDRTARQQGAPGHLEPVQWIDTHVHTTGGGRQSSDDFYDTVNQARAAIGDAGFVKAILMPTPQLHSTPNGFFTLEGFITEAKRYPDQFAFLGGGGTLNPMINDEAPDGNVSESLRRRFKERAEDIIAQGAVGFGEMAALHFSLADKHPFESVPADHPLFLLLADIAARHDVPIDLHLEPVVKDIPTPDYLRGRNNPDGLKRNIDGFERLLAHNRKTKIVWAHAGTALLPHRTLELTRELMERHPNLYLQIGVRPGKVKETRILGVQGIKREWLPLLKQYADRIVLGGDQFFSPSGNRGPAAEFAKAATNIRKRFGKLLSSLPHDLARKIGYENAVRIYKLHQ